MAEKFYVNSVSVKTHTFPDGGELLKVGVKVDDFIAFLHANRKANGFVDLTVQKRASGPSQYGQTHSVCLDTFTPRTGAGARQDARQDVTPRTVDPLNDFDVPF